MLQINLANSFTHDNVVAKVIWDAMENHEECMKVFTGSYKWFTDFPDFKLYFNSKYDYRMWVDYNCNELFQMSLERLNQLVKKLISVFRTENYTCKYGSISRLVAGTFFNIRSNKEIELSYDQLSFVEFSTPIIPKNMEAWIERAKQYDFTWMMADRPNNSWDEYAKNLWDDAEILGLRRCVLYYNWILKRARQVDNGRTNFGNLYEGSYLTKEEAHKEFGVYPINTIQNRMISENQSIIFLE